MNLAVGADRIASVLAWFRQSAYGAQKIHEDFRRYQEVIRSVRPTVVVETGTGSGHAALWFADEGLRVVTVDLEAWPDELTRAVWGDRVIQIVGDSTAPGTVEAVRRAVGFGEPVLVSLDSDHSARHVRAEMEAYASFVTPGSYMVVEDSVLAWMPTNSPPRCLFDGTPAEAIKDFLATHDGWRADDEIEGMFPATQHPGGWLWRAA